MPESAGGGKMDSAVTESNSIMSVAGDEADGASNGVVSMAMGEGNGSSGGGGEGTGVSIEVLESSSRESTSETQCSNPKI